MSREVVINATPDETRVIVLESGRAAEIHVERGDEARVGNVYLGRVDKVVPGMQSAFVDIGQERHAFLHVSDLDPPTSEEAATGLERRRAAAARAIEGLVSEGDELLVQVTREPLGRKGARVTTHVTLPGQYLVHVPRDAHVGISRRIEDAGIRDRLRQVVEGLQDDVQGGCIVRAAAADAPEEALAAELRELARTWRTILDRRRVARAPALIHAAAPLALRVVRDALAGGCARILVDDEPTFEQVRDALKRHDAGRRGGEREDGEADAGRELRDLVERWGGEGPIFEALDLEREIEKALRPRVWLKSGGTLVINQSEALVAIDVNTGKFTGSRRLEETALKTNLEAAREVARQLRLRDLGGIVVIDFIDMDQPEHRHAVLNELQGALARDRAKSSVLGMSDFGLVQLTRQRQRASLERSLSEGCPCCGGSGRVKSVDSIVGDVLRKLRRLPPGSRALRVRVHPDVARALQRRFEEVEGTGAALATPVSVEEAPGMRRQAFEILS